MTSSWDDAFLVDSTLFVIVTRIQYPIHLVFTVITLDLNQPCYFEVSI